MRSNKVTIEMVPTVDARDLSPEAEDYCLEHDFSTHYDSGIHQLELDGNPLQRFFESHGVTFPADSSSSSSFALIGIIGT